MKLENAERNELKRVSSLPPGEDPDLRAARQRHVAQGCVILAGILK